MQLIARLVLVAGIGLTIYGGFELSLALRGTSQPQALTAAELGRKGPVKNVHVTITDFKAGDGFLAETRDGKWTSVWVPLFTPDGQWTERPIMARVNHVANEVELSNKIDQAQLTGMITNGVQNFGTKQQGEIAPSYPGVDLSDAIAFQVDRSFPSAALCTLALIVGVVLLVGGGGVTFGLIKLNRS